MAFLVLGVVATACSSPPVAEFTVSSDSGPVPLEIQFTPVEESDDVTYSWEFGDGATSTERNPTHVYEDAGDLLVRLTASRGDSQTTTERRIRTEPGEAGWITVEPGSVVVESGERVQLKPVAFDALGNPVPDAEFSWTADSDTGEVLDDGTFVAGPKIGARSQGLRVEYERLGRSASLDVPVEVVYGELDSIVVQPPAINLRVNGRIDIEVIARDKQGHVLPEPEIEWTVARQTIDSVLTGGEFRAGSQPTAGERTLVEVTVTAGSRTLSQEVSGTITAGILDRIEVAANPEQSTVGSQVALSAEAFDRFGNPVKLESLDWAVADESYGEITSEGVFTPAGAAVTADGPLVIATGELDRVRATEGVELDILPGIAAGIILSPLADSIPVGAGNPISALVVDDFGNVIDGVGVTWTASGGGTITENGIFTAGFETGEFPGAITASVPQGASGNLQEISASVDMTVRDRSSDMLAVEVSNQTDAGIILIDLVNASIQSLSEELDNNGGVEVSPAWWPDGSRLAYSSDVSGTMQIYDIEIETGKIRQLVDIEGGSAMPAISPDATKIAFVSIADDDWQLYVADLPSPDEQGNITPVTLEDATKLSDNDDVQNLLPWWSPDSSRILFTTSRSATDVDLNIVSADGSSTPRKIGRAGLSGFGWSDDGEFVLSVDNQSGGARNLLVLSADTGGIVGFVPLPFQAFIASWAPDNSEVAVIDRVTGALWLVDADGTSIRQAIGSNFVPRRPAWRPVPIDAEAVLAQMVESPDDAA